MSLLEKIKLKSVPRHIAIIMDGNGRWAKAKGMDRAYGHKEGTHAVRRALEASAMAGVDYLTLYAFSTENWNRPDEEINALMELMIHAVSSETENLLNNNVRLQCIGDIDKLPIKTKEALNGCLKRTSVSTGTTLTLALSYSSRWEIVNAVKIITEEIEKGAIREKDVDEELFSTYLTTNGMPDPDLLIRTGGEKRISNFLLWQAAYSELYFTNILWPDFTEEELYYAIDDYQKRERRFGKISEQLNS